MSIIGAHVLLYTPEAEKLRATFRDVLGWHHVDAGDGWLIFRLPAAEVGVHPADAGDTHHELSFICDDVAATVTQLRASGIDVRGEPKDMGFGVGTTLVLPGGVEVLLYEPKHATAI